jgi:hypothetical protein
MLVAASLTRWSSVFFRREFRRTGEGFERTITTRCADAQIVLSDCRRGAGDRDGGERLRPDQYAQRVGGRAARLLGAAADGAVASRHADHGVDELQAQRRAIRTAKDRFSVEGSVGDATLVIPHRRGANAQPDWLKSKKPDGSVVS